ncbi:MAG: MBG domain-containing protein, partial [Clostridia bacterium]|nr:MBG domain-containing protein [Clostridia bacterium]
MHLINLDDTYQSVSLSYTFSYRIQRANYDLSATAWDYTVLTYNGATQRVTLKNIPTGLTPIYSGNSAINAQAGGYRASVILNNNNPNYNDPVANDTSSYDGSFAWTLDWNISPQVIELSWNNVPWTDKNGIDDVIPQLSVHQEKVTYQFYTADGAPIALEDIEIDMGNQTLYYVDAVLLPNFDGNYALSTVGNHRAFTLGKQRTPVNISLQENTWTFDGVAKEVQLIISGASLTQDNFNIVYVNELGDPISGAPINAGSYTVRVSLKDEYAETYYIADNSPIEITINNAEIDLSGVRWNYDAANPFQYQRKDGQPLPYTVELTGLPEFLEKYVEYGGVYSGSSVDTYNATFDFVGLNLDNFVDFDLPEEVASKTLSWRIIPRAIPKPIYEGEELIFNNEDMDIFALLGIDEDWAEYFTVNIRYNNEATDATSARNAGTYSIVCNLLSDLGDNATWADGDVFAATAQLTVSPRIVTVNGWTSSTIPAPQVGDGELKFINQVYTDENGAPVSRDEIMTTFNSTFRVSLESAFGDNVIVRAAEEVSDWKEFSTPSDPNNPPTPIAKPTLVKDKLLYTGGTLTFEITCYDDTIMTIIGALSVTDMGDYSVLVRFKNGANYCWEDNTRDPITLAFSVVDHIDGITAIEKPSAEKESIDYTGEEITFVLNGYDENTMTLEGALSGKEEGEYTVTITPKEGYCWTDNTTEAITITFKIVKPSNGSNGGGILDKIKDFFAELDEKHFPLWQICTGIVAIILILIFTGKTISYGNKKRAAKKEAKKYNERNYTAAAAMLPIFAADEVLFGLSNKIWSIMAFALVGACVL